MVPGHPWNFYQAARACASKFADDAEHKGLLRDTCLQTNEFDFLSQTLDDPKKRLISFRLVRRELLNTRLYASKIPRATSQPCELAVLRSCGVAVLQSDQRLAK
jgi:hypothetical protein